jgi:hypothetical protein
MKAYTYSEARENFASVLEEAERYGAVEIRRRGFSHSARSEVQVLALGRAGREAQGGHGRPAGGGARRTRTFASMSEIGR